MEKVIKEEACAAKEFSIDELKGMLHQTSEQARSLFDENKKLRKVVEEMNMTNLFKRLDYLFAVVNSTSEAFSADFKSQCASEIQNMMFAPEPEEEKE